MESTHYNTKLIAKMNFSMGSLMLFDKDPYVNL